LYSLKDMLTAKHVQGCQMVVVRRRVFPEAFKREAVDRVAISGQSVAAIAAEMEIHETILRRWMNQFGPGDRLRRIEVGASALKFQNR
jgi:transposase-like protein